jgi:membrane protease YdiL (CAAX protease family)
VVLAASGRTPEEQDDLPLSLVLITQLGLWLGLFGVPWLATRLKGNGLVADLRLRFERGDLWRGGILGILLQLVVIPLVYWPLLDLLDKSAKELEGPARELTDRADGAIGVLLLVLIVGIGAPIVEEVFYRGFLQGALIKRGLPPVAAIGITSFVFAASHFELLQLPALALFGLLAGVLAHRSGRLGPSIAAHLAFNMVTVVALLA